MAGGAAESWQSDTMGPLAMTDAVIVLEDQAHIVWVLEIQFHMGTRQRRVYQDFDEADEAYKYARDKADTDWQKLHRVNIATEWNMVMST